MTNLQKMKTALTVTYFGNWFNMIAIITSIYAITGSKATIGIIFVIKFSPKVVFSFLSSFILDKYSKKKILVISEIISALSVLGMLFFLVYYVSLPMKYIFILNASVTVFDIGRISLVPNLCKNKSDYTKVLSDFSIIR